jgi:hypothetical protein
MNDVDKQLWKYNLEIQPTLSEGANSHVLNREGALIQEKVRG